MFLGQFAELRKEILSRHDLRSLGDFDRGAFDEVPNELLAVTVSILRREAYPDTDSVALQPTRLDDNAYDRERTSRKRSATLAHVGRFDFDPRAFEVIESEPIVYWWPREFLAEYAKAPKLGAKWRIRKGLTTCNNTRFVRRVWEVSPATLSFKTNDGRALSQAERHQLLTGSAWAPWIDGGEGRAWQHELDTIVRWKDRGLEIATAPTNRYGRGEAYYFVDGVAFSMIGSVFAARRHRFRSIIGNMGASIYGEDLESVLCQLNGSTARWILQSLNPGVHFEKADVDRVCIEHNDNAADIVRFIESAFSEHEAGREPSVEFRRPAPSSWHDAQLWAQRAVDRRDNQRLPPYTPKYEPPTPEAFVSFAVGVAFGRFSASGEGVHPVATTSALSAGTLFITNADGDSLDHPAAMPIRAAWDEHGKTISGGDDLHTYLRTSFFAYHKKLYENRPIYFPLSSVRKNFVAFVSIHRWQADTLNALLADYLMPTKRRLDGELDDLRVARATGTNKRQAERRFTEVQRLLEELNDFIDKVTEVAERGPPPTDDGTPKREVDARHEMDLDDGVMVNSAALWPLLEPQWKAPKKWWKELATAKGKKDYDWAHLAARYFPTRVRKKCHEDPSLAVAHRCFWELHSAKAYAWELRLQDEIRPDFTIDEPGSDAARAKFLAEHEREIAEIKANELKRRARKAAKADDDSESGPLFDREPQGTDDAYDAEDDSDD